MKGEDMDVSIGDTGKTKLAAKGASFLIVFWAQVYLQGISEAPPRFLD